MKQRSQRVGGLPQAQSVGVYAGHRREEFGVWLTSREAMRFTHRRSLKGWYEFKRKHGIVATSAGLVSRRDCERAMLTPRKPGSGRNAASLNNLRLRHGKHTTPVVASVSASIAEVGVANG